MPTEQSGRVTPDDGALMSYKEELEETVEFLQPAEIFAPWW
jgi:hypothetical protein